MQRLAAPLAALAVLLVPALGRAQERVIDGDLPQLMVRVWVPEAIEPVAAPPPVAPPDRAALRAMLAQRRRAHLAELRRYVAAGDFPVNSYAEGFLNVFQDEQGHLCAVANLIAHDGALELVRATAASTNFVRLADVHEGPLLDWMLASGFTQEEIARIQEPYMEIGIERPLGLRERLEREKQRLRRVLRRVIGQLGRDTRRSLDVAVDRLITASGGPV